MQEVLHCTNVNVNHFNVNQLIIYDRGTIHALLSGIMALVSTQPLNRNEYQEHFLGVIEKNDMAGHVARISEERGCIGSWWGNRRERDHRGDLGVDGWIILGWISRRWDVGIWTGLGWSRIEIGGGRL